MDDGTVDYGYSGDAIAWIKADVDNGLRSFHLAEWDALATCDAKARLARI